MAAKRRRKRRNARKNNKMKLLICGIVELAVLLTLVVVVGWNYGVKDWFQGIGRPVVRELDLSGLQSPYAALMQVKGGKFIGEQGGDEIIYPASMTKIMTAVVAMEELDGMDEEITLPAEIFTELYARDATQAGFQPGETVRAVDLLYGALLPSGGECCLGLANAVAGSEEAFVELMNKKASRIGMNHTHFCDTTGLHDPDHYSTVRDMAVLLKYALRKKDFREIIESPYHSTPGTNLHPGGITYYSTMFNALPNPAVTGGQILGGKTGFTNEAGYCLASFAEVGGREYILVTAGAPASAGAAPHIQDAVTVYSRLGEAIAEAGQ